RMMLPKWTIETLAGTAALFFLAMGATAQAPVAPPQKPAPVPVQAPAAPATPAAVVNGEPITVAEIEAVVKLFPPPATPLTETQKHQMQLEALDMLIDDVLIRQFLGKTVAKVEPAEVAKEMEQLLAGLKARNLTLQDFLRDTHQTEDHLRMDIVKK